VTPVAVCANFLSSSWSEAEILELPTPNLTVASPFTSYSLKRRKALRVLLDVLYVRFNLLFVGRDILLVGLDVFLLACQLDLVGFQLPAVGLELCTLAATCSAWDARQTESSRLFQGRRRRP